MMQASKARSANLPVSSAAENSFVAPPNRTLIICATIAVSLLALIVATPSWPSPPRLAFFVMALGCIGFAIVWWLAEVSARRFLLGMFVASFLVRLLFALFLIKVIPTLAPDHPYLSQGFLGDDGFVYDSLGWKWLGLVQAGQNPLATYETSAPAFVASVSAIYALLGHEVFALQALNILLGSLIPIFVYLIAKQFVSETHARIATVITAFYPEQVIYSGSQFKEIAITLTFVMGVWAISQFNSRNHARHRLIFAALVIFCTACVALTRFYFGPLLLMALAFSSLMKLGIHSSLRQTIWSGSLVAVLLALNLWLFPISRPRIASEYATVNDAVAATYSSYSEPTPDRPNSFYEIVQDRMKLMSYPVNAVLTLLNPFILWPFTSPDPLYWILLPAILSWYILMPFILYGTAITYRHGFGLIVFLVTLMAFAILVVTGVGLTTAGRIKVPLQPFWMIYAAVGLKALADHNSAMRSLAAGYGLVLSGLIAVYIVVKQGIISPLSGAIALALASAGVALVYLLQRLARRREFVG